GRGVRFGLHGIRNLGVNLVRAILDHREKDGPYTGLYDFCRRLSGRELNKRAVETLISIGAFDSLQSNRRMLMQAVEGVFAAAQEEELRNRDGQVGFFDRDPLVKPLSDADFCKPCDDFSRETKIEWELQSVGVAFSGDLFDSYVEGKKAAGCVDIATLLDPEGPYANAREPVTVLARLTEARERKTKAGSMMLSLSCMDNTGILHGIAFPQVYARYTDHLKPSSVLLLTGRPSMREEGEVELIVDAIRLPGEEPAARPAKPAKSARYPGLHLKIDSQEGARFERVCAILTLFGGSVPVYMYFADSGKKLRAPQRLWTQPDPVMLGELRRILGEKNVVEIESEN
ncbi:MAG: hypothetical protein J6X61_06115, partial [Clostridia bacterium]|nr:hypothetical protein [Clostridia bacterium]